MTAKTAKQPLSDNTRKLIIIIAIVLVAVIVLSIALALILKEDVKTPADENTGSNGSSNLPIENGDFMYYSSDDTAYPYTATDWTKYGYEDGSSFKTIATNAESVMGIVNLDDWEEVLKDLNDAGVNSLPATAPKLHQELQEVEDREENNIYMIHNREAYAASILSDQVSVSTGASVKITVWLNMSYVKESDKAVIMIQKSSPTFPTEEYRYAYDYEIEKSADADENGWQKHEFYVFNRETSTQYIKVSVGLGNAYQADKTAEGTLFIDDITYETVTANEYRIQVDGDADRITDKFHPYKILEDEDIEDEMKYIELQAGSNTTIDGTYASFDQYKDGEKLEEDEAYLPFTKRDDFGTDDDPTGFTIYKISKSDSELNMFSLRLLANDDNAGTHGGINLATSPINKDHYHISFWVRVMQYDGHQATSANVYVQKWVDGDWETVTTDSYGKPTATFAEITTSQDVDTDNNCGWVKYDIYLKPSTADDYEISILFVLGEDKTYTDEDKDDGMLPQGSLYVTSPAYEVISSKDYSNASTGGGHVQKINMVGDSANASVTNGSFTDVNNVGNQPTSWTPVFAGDNAIYKDGKGDKLDDKYKTVDKIAGSGIVTDESLINDSQAHALKIATNGTSYGYISNDITLSSRTVYVFSVMVKVVTGENPYIYLINTAKETREEAIVAKVDQAYGDEYDGTLDDKFNYYSNSDDAFDGGKIDKDGWTRYYIVYITDTQSVTLRLALFSGAIDATDEDLADATASEVIYNNVELKAIGTYSIVDSEDEDATQYDISFSANNGYDDAIEDLFGKDNTDGSLNDESEIVGIIGNDALTQPDEDTWTEMRVIPEDDDDNNGNEEDNTTKTPSNVDWGMLFSVISSVVLVAALLIVFVIKVFQARKHNRAA